MTPIAMRFTLAQGQGLRSVSGSGSSGLSLRVCASASAKTLVAPRRNFAASGISRAQNQAYDSVRRPSDLHTYTRLASTSRIPLLTLWTTSYCPSCRTVAPLIRSLVEDERVGEAEGGVAFCTVEFDAPDIMNSSDYSSSGGGGVGGLGGTFMINSVPTLLSFNDAGDPVTRTKVTDVRNLSSREFLEEWIRREARESGSGGRGSGGVGGILGGLFGGWR